MENKDTGLLLHKEDIALQRMWFKQMTELIGLKVLYRAPRKDKEYDLHGELDAHYYEPEIVGCIYDDHPTQQTMKKLGWNAELQGNTTLIHVPYDLEGCEVGGLFIIPSGLDAAKGRVFRILKMTNIAIYPASICCELGPVLENEFERRQVKDFHQTNFNLLNEEED